MQTSKKTLVLGASANPMRYSNMALKKLRRFDHPVVAIGKKTTAVDDVTIHQDKLPFEKIHTVTIYLNPQNQEEYYHYILSLHPKRIIFNPGTENPILENLAVKNNIETMQACTLVLLSTGQY